MSDAPTLPERGRFFRNGPAPVWDALDGEGAELVASAHMDALGAALADLTQGGFEPTRVAIDHLRQDRFAEHLWRLADEASAWIAADSDARSLVQECAADLLGALAVLYRVRGECITGWGGPACGAAISADAATRLVAAAQMVGVQEMMLTCARLGYLDQASLFQIEREQARAHGAAVGKSRRDAAEHWREQARADWADYAGQLSRTAWAKANAHRYKRKWRAVSDAIQGDAQSLQQGRPLQA